MCILFKFHFYIVKLGYIFFFLILFRNRDCGYSLEPPHFMFGAKMLKTSKNFPLQFLFFTGEKNSLCIAWACLRIGMLNLKY